MPTIKLTYFNGKGRAELSRLILAAANLPYEDVRISGNEWGELKPKTPFGSLPILEYEGETLAQSITVARFLAKKAGLAGKTELEQAQADMIVDHILDIQSKLIGIMFANDPESKKKLKVEFFENYLPTALKFAEELLKKRGGKYFVANQLSWADIAVMQSCDSIKAVADSESNLDIASKFPLLDELSKRVHDNPGIKAWIAKRPDTSF